MMKLTQLVRLSLVAAVLGGTSRLGAATNRPIEFKELYDLLRTHLAGADDAGLNRAAVNGLLSELKPRVMVIPDTAVPPATNAPPLLAKTVFDAAIAYLRVGQVRDGLDQDLWSAYTALASSNRIKGVVLDLRFADGQDYAAAAAVADRFFTNQLPLIDWGEGLRKSTAKADAIQVPVALLINRKTAGAAEALAGILRQNDIGLLLGATTEGRASIGKEFTLKTGQRVRLAVAPVKVAGGEPLSHTGLKPDIRVDVNLDDERAWYDDAYRVPPKPANLASADNAPTNETAQATTNRALRRRMNEAELVRMLREGQSPDDVTNVTLREAESARSVVRDPALARAIDLLKGLAVVQRFKSL
jgi:hypothetical protein